MKLNEVNFEIDPCLLEPNFIRWLLDGNVSDAELERAVQTTQSTPSRNAETTCKE